MSAPALGLGTAPMLGRVGRRASVAALESAYDLGIRHVDTARSYGWGEAEALVGSVLGRHPRDSYTLVTKCGLLPARRSPLLSAAKRVGRVVYARVRVGRSLVRRVASAPAFQPRSTYDVAALRASLDTSLRALRTDYVDTLLLHNSVPGAPLQDVVTWFAQERQAGRTRRYGFSIEGDLLESLAFLRSEYGALDDAVVQAPVSEALLALPAEWRCVPIVAHSLFAFIRSRPDATFGSVVNRLAAIRCEAVVASMFSRAHQVDNLRIVRSVALNS